MAASAGTVTLDLDANSVKLIRELQRAQTKTKRTAGRMRADMGKAFRAMGRAAAVFGVALAAAIKLSVNFANQIAKSADKLGVGIEALQEFRFAAKRAGVEQNTLDMALQRFTRRVGEAAVGTGEAKQALKDLNIQLTDGHGRIRKTEDLLLDVADSFAKVESPAERLRLAFKLFDSEGAALVNMLSNGSAGLNKVRQDARDLGVVMKESLVRDAERAADKMEDLQKVLQIRIAETVLENTDAIIALTDSLIGFVTTVGRAVKGWNDWLAAQGIGVDSLDEIRRRGAELLEERLKLQAKLDAIDPASTGYFKNVERRVFQERIDQIIAEQMALQDRAIALQKGQAKPPEGPTIAPGVISSGQTQAEADKIAKIILDLQNEIRGFGKDEGDQVLLSLIDSDATEEQLLQVRHFVNELRILQQEQDAAKQVTEDREEQIKETLQKRNELEAEYAGLVSSTQTDIEAHHEQLRRIEELYLAGIIPSAEAYYDILGRVTTRFEESRKEIDQMSVFADEAARNMQSAFADFLFDPFDQGLKGMLTSFAATIQRMVAEALAADILKSIFGTGEGGGFGNFLSSIFGGTKALGGPVAAGVPYLVGERGPELVVPRSAGTVMPNNRLGTTYNTTVNLPPTVQRRTATQTADEVGKVQKRASARNG